MTAEATTETLDAWARRVAPTLDDIAWDEVFTPPACDADRVYAPETAALLAYVESLEANLSERQAQRLYDRRECHVDDPKTGERIWLVASKWDGPTPLGRAVLRASTSGMDTSSHTSDIGGHDIEIDDGPINGSIGELRGE